MNDIVRETMELVKRFQQLHPGKRLEISRHGIRLVDATPQEELDWKENKNENGRT